MPEGMPISWNAFLERTRSEYPNLPMSRIKKIAKEQWNKNLISDSNIYKMPAKKSKPKKGVIPPALRAWHEHLTKFRKAHPAMPMKKAMHEAKRTYKK
jgi:hypothetical protein